MSSEISKEEMGCVLHGICSDLSKNPTEEARHFIEAGADVNARGRNGRTPLHVAKHPELTQLLIAKGADVNARDDGERTPLFFATDEEVVKVLIEAGANVNAKDNQGTTPLHVATQLNSARLLIKAGADVNARDNFGTPTYLLQRLISTDVANLIKTEIERRSLQANVAQPQAQPVKRKVKAYI